MRQLLHMMLEIHMMFVPRKGCSEKFRGKRLQQSNFGKLADFLRGLCSQLVYCDGGF